MARGSIKYIEELASKWEETLKNAFLSAIADIANRVPINALAERLERGDVEGALRLVNLDPGDFSQLALDQAAAYSEAGRRASDTIRPVLVAGVLLRAVFNVATFGARAWIQARTDALIRRILEDQSDSIRSYLTTELAAGRSPRLIAVLLVGPVNSAGERVGGVIGLSASQELAVASYAADLASTEPAALRNLLKRGLRDRRFDQSIEKAIREGTGLPAAIQSKMRTAYADRALKLRADNIARNEVTRTLSAAQTEAFRQAIDKGIVQQSGLRRFWRTQQDERVRHNHRLIPSMNARGVGWSEPFQTPTGASMHAPHDNEETDHGCRCYEALYVNGKYVSQARGHRKTIYRNKVAA